MQKFFKWELYLTVLVVLQMPRPNTLDNQLPHYYRFGNKIYDGSCLQYLILEAKLSRKAARQISRKIPISEKLLLQMTDEEIREDVIRIRPGEIVDYHVTAIDLKQLFAVLDIDRQALKIKNETAIALQKKFDYVAGVYALLRKAAPGAEPGRIHKLSLLLNLIGTLSRDATNPNCGK